MGQGGSGAGQHGSQGSPAAPRRAAGAPELAQGRSATASSGASSDAAASSSSSSSSSCCCCVHHVRRQQGQPADVLQAYNCYFLICLLLFLGGLVEVLSWILFFCWPHKIHATLASATLSNLTVSNASTAAEVSYNLAATLRLYNPSSDVSIYYDTISAELRFRDAVLGPAAKGTSPAEFYQRRKTTDHVKLEFDYGRGVAVPSDVVGELETEVKSGGAINMELYVHLRVRYKFELFKMREKPEL
ncbi:NDR1/HIN1-like protein 10 [Panicum virgatum]|uniref:NDR1/HIN1-like protein 10 n=1 Tax=Panicum virgatum TaxID=38727 RepID=UPI0019D62738|nr:NDR1/HIN1-like protein 10 [Panicum virgatum]